MKLVFATGNKGKLREASEILGPEFELLSAAEAGVVEDVEETGLTLKENSIIKAEFIYSKTGMDCFADDTGLEVDALGGAPGVRTARYAGEGCVFEDNIRKLLAELAKLDPSTPRTARFRSIVTLIIGGEKHFFEGVMEGRIALKKSGHEGFGYDPVFIPDLSADDISEYFNGVSPAPNTTVAEMTEEIKNAISHRGKALRAMAAWLNNSR
ncbi:MAG: RdgB/HAM1 family non-canonical purine NTP pyrophosphatase [Bacteroidales bacterium]|nr:RdgB/HAM1 family non-canonical purine NTP pyrophosphatase [Bacteroidales bacterium]